MDDAGREKAAWYEPTAIPELVKVIESVPRPRKLFISEGPLRLKNAVTIEANGRLYISVDLSTIGKGLPPEPTESARIPEAFHVIADCVDEAGQRRAYELLRHAGFKCRVLTL